MILFIWMFSYVQQHLMRNNRKYWNEEGYWHEMGYLHNFKTGSKDSNVELIKL